ncbi:MAG: DUF4974 domain-containing protein [Muribaculaceae bacterium]|nr:DUF4974 domain-containing protein [Muribaculaceae bacterium]
MEDKYERIFEAIDYPEQFSEQEIQELLEDEETARLYKMLNKCADALSESSEPDIDKEWEKFSKERKKALTGNSFRSLRSFLVHNAAAVLIAIFASFAVIAATISVSKSMRNADYTSATVPEGAQKESNRDIKTVGNDSIGNRITPYENNETVIFKNEPLETIITVIANHYGTPVSFHSAASKQLRLYFQWDKNLTLDEVIEQLNNFEQIKIKIKDNIITIE